MRNEIMKDVNNQINIFPELQQANYVLTNSKANEFSQKLSQKLEETDRSLQEAKRANQQKAQEIQDLIRSKQTELTRAQEKIKSNQKLLVILFSFLFFLFIYLFIFGLGYAFQRYE